MVKDKNGNIYLNKHEKFLEILHEALKDPKYGWSEDKDLLILRKELCESFNKKFGLKLKV